MLHFHVFKGLIYLAQKGWDMGLLSRGGGHLREQERIQGYVRKVQELEARAKDRGTNFVLTPSELIEQLERFDRKILTDPRRVMCDVDRLLTWIWCKDWKHTCMFSSLLSWIPWMSHSILENSCVALCWRPCACNPPRARTKLESARCGISFTFLPTTWKLPSAIPSLPDRCAPKNSLLEQGCFSLRHGALYLNCLFFNHV